MPYFPYSRQSKKKSHRGSITARMIANMLDIAGVNHVITIDLHATQMQGFFHCPVDNLVAEPLLASWVKINLPGWQKAVVVSKNPGGTKRVTSLADALKVNFGIVMTDRRRPRSGRTSMNASMIFDRDAAQIYPESGLDGVPELADFGDAKEAEILWTNGRNLAQSMKSNGIRGSPLKNDGPHLEIPGSRSTNSDVEEHDYALSRVQTAPSAMVNDSSDDEMDSVGSLEAHASISADLPSVLATWSQDVSITATSSTMMHLRQRRLPLPLQHSMGSRDVARTRMQCRIT